MMAMNPSEIGRYGTLRLMKRLDPTVVVTSYPIDDEQVSFGCDTNCSVRLYYPDVSPIHCKIIFRENKGFLIVLGEAGLLIDGCQVHPSSSQSSPRTVPLTNNSEIEIHGKRFRFTYPPKEFRASLASIFDSPVKKTNATPGRKRALRMSMIQSAEVFSPRPSHDPRVNLRILQSPLKGRVSRSPVKPRTTSVVPEEAEVETEIVLVDGNHPRVVEEEKDLVILEDVEVEVDTPTPTLPQRAVTPYIQLPPHTPPRPPVQRSSASLHRAVLIRSAQRAVMKMEMEKEEALEEQEVVAFVGEVSDESCNDVSEEDASEEDASDKDGEGEDKKSPGALSRLRKSLEAVTGYFRDTSQDNCKERDITEIMTDQGGRDEEHEHEHEHEGHGDDDDNEDEKHNTTPPASVRPRTLGHFMTPQPQFSRAAHAGKGRGAGRYSYGGFRDEPQRVMVQPAWKVRDIVVPEEREEDDWGTTNMERRTRVTVEERKAIQERRKSALKMPTFGGIVPGTRRTPDFPSTPIKEKVEAPQDTRLLLEKMKETVEGMKRRQSTNPSDGDQKNVQSMSLAVRMSLSPSKRDDEFGKLFDPSDDEDCDGGEIQYEEAEVETRLEEMDEMVNEKTNQGMTDSINKTPIGAAPSAPTKTPHMDIHHLFADPRAAPMTPSYKGVKDIFKDKVWELETPKMDGVRDMFLRERGMQMQTPVFEGVGQMMRTPEGWRAPAGEGVADKPASASADQAATKDKVAPSRRRTPRATGRSTALGDEDVPPVPDSAGVRRGRSKQVGNDVQEESSVPALPKRKARLIRNKKVSPIEDIPEDSVIEKKMTAEKQALTVEVDVATENTESATTSEHVDIDEDATPPPSLKPGGRGRKLDGEEAKETTSPPKGRRTPKTKTVSEPDVAPPPKSTTRKGRVKSKVTDKIQATSGRRGTRAKPTELGDDPLDSIGNPEPEVYSPDEQRPKSKSRSRTNTAEVVKEEVVEPTAPRSARGKKTPAATKTKSKTPADDDTSAPRVRSTRNATPTSISDSATLENNGDKENAPRLADEDEVVKTTTRGRRGAAKAKDADEEPAVLERTRTRTRTGGRK